MEHVLKLREYALWSKFDKVFLKYIATNFENMLKEERVGEKHDLKRYFAECPLAWHSTKVGLPSAL